MKLLDESNTGWHITALADWDTADWDTGDRSTYI